MVSDIVSDIANHRRAVGSFGEQVAAQFLERRGCLVLDRNLRVGRGEIDLIIEVGGAKVAVEVKSVVDSKLGEAADAFTVTKASQVAALAEEIGIGRVDLITVTLGPKGVDIVWTPRVV